MKLTDTQFVLVSAASERDGCAIEIAPNVEGAAAHNLVANSWPKGWSKKSKPAARLPVWRRDDDHGPLALRITKLGLAARKQEAARYHRFAADVVGRPAPWRRDKARVDLRQPFAANRLRYGAAITSGANQGA
jgi:hypothetical protein